MDRASGSGVFARDPDAQLDMIELELTDEVQNWVAKRGATAWRLEGSLREFENFTPVNFWFEYPLHRLDTNEDLKPLPTQGSADAGRLKSKYHKSTEFAEEEFRTAFQAVNFDGSGSTVADMAAYMGLAERTIRDRIKKMNGEFILENGIVRMTSDVPDLVPEE